MHGLNLQAELLHRLPDSLIRGEDRQNGVVNYLQAAKHLVDVPTFERVRYQNVYRGIDLVYYGNQQRLEYDFVVNPGSEVDDIQIRFDGADRISLNPDGDLVLQKKSSQIVQHKPIVYQGGDASRRNIQGRYRLLASNTVGFEIGPYDHSAPVVIDPILSYSTFLGGSDGDDDARAVATDSSGNVYITGSTTSANFPVVSAIQSSPGSSDTTSDAFVAKLNAAGTSLIYATYIGGSNDDQANAIGVDSSGNAIIAGWTTSTDFPTNGAAIRRTCNAPATGSCFDAFVVKLNPT
ncbi:MAG TPA: SBBP repeat-containing protein, partial [Terriglobia bacterium]|nr:SBBP repeat-containing protein [Terriglobia bacterium]